MLTCIMLYHVGAGRGEDEGGCEDRQAHDGDKFEHEKERSNVTSAQGNRYDDTVESCAGGGS